METWSTAVGKIVSHVLILEEPIIVQGLDNIQLVMLKDELARF